MPDCLDGADERNCRKYAVGMCVMGLELDNTAKYTVYVLQLFMDIQYTIQRFGVAKIFSCF